MLVRPASADCLKFETLGTPVLGERSGLYLPLQATGAPFLLPRDLSLIDGITIGRGGTTVVSTARGWYLIAKGAAVGTLDSVQSGTGRSCAEVGSRIERVLQSVASRLQLSIGKSCVWRSRATRREQTQDCFEVRDLGLDGKLDVSLWADRGTTLALAVTSGTLVSHAAHYGGAGAFVTCRSTLAASQDEELVASLVSFERDEPERAFAAIDADGCLGWLAGRVSLDELGQVDLSAILRNELQGHP